MLTEAAYKEPSNKKQKVMETSNDEKSESIGNSSDEEDEENDSENPSDFINRDDIYINQFKNLNNAYDLFSNIKENLIKSSFKSIHEDWKDGMVVSRLTVQEHEEDKSCTIILFSNTYRSYDNTIIKVVEDCAYIHYLLENRIKHDMVVFQIFFNNIEKNVCLVNDITKFVKANINATAVLNDVSSNQVIEDVKKILNEK